MNHYNPFSLEGKTILVTGASSGIGQQSAIEMSKLGATVILTARNEERLNETYSKLEGDSHRIIIADLTKPEQLSYIVDELPQINGVLLCAGKGLKSPFPFCTTDKYQDIFDVNLFGPVELLRQLVKKKRLEKESSVVIISSIGGIMSYGACNVAYGASKAALNSVMKYCAKELAPKRIRVNCICPGMVETPLIHSGMVSDEQLLADVATYPLKRYGKPEDIAYGAIYLLSDAASWITGHSLVIDGGKTI